MRSELMGAGRMARLRSGFINQGALSIGCKIVG